MPFPVLEDYMKRLPKAANGSRRIWLDAQGCAQGRYFNCTLTSAFQPVRLLGSRRIAGYEAFIRSYSEHDPGLSVWRLLERAASDDESVELDRLCRMLHAINFYRQAESAAADLYLSVHDRLLTAVGSNHGMVFRRILDNLGLPVKRIILQLPSTTPNQSWLLNYVMDNYRRNGFRIAVNAVDAADGLRLLENAGPDAIKLDAREIADPAAAAKLLSLCRTLGVELLFKRVENAHTIDMLYRMRSAGQAILVQGYAWDIPNGILNPQGVSVPAPARQRSAPAPAECKAEAG